MPRRQGFTIIELLIVVAIIAILAAVAIPNLLASRIRANEATAITCVKQYGSAQVTFQSGRQGRNTINTSSGNQGYCDNFVNLYYGAPVGDPARQLQFISQTFADAFIGGKTMHTPIAGTPLNPSDPYQGYLFAEPTDLAIGDFATNFALTGSPANAGYTGNNSYWCGPQGVVFIKGEAAGTPAGMLGGTPSDPAFVPSPATWLPL